MLIPQSALTAGKHALLIGIQDYSKTPFNSLKGPFNDIELTKGVLRERFGFQNDDFIIIKDATHTGIEKAFKKLINRVNPHDFVYIFYSGHGSQTKDLNGEEPSGYDQTWVSYGARTGRDDIDDYDVLDDEINAWLIELYAKTDQIVFISDSCHSGTVTRGPTPAIRFVKDDNRPHLLGERPYKRLTTHHGIRIGAARDDESAMEFPRKDQYYGLFTWYWTQNLQQAQAGNTWVKSCCTDNRGDKCLFASLPI
ncbi:peptidase C14 caspase catalytic subunit p20 [Candidatus Thiomargarita nelsonii]|uniref:Peptidase C14 caspase catalytic subunit p20 n=1 Tax=Candidatus Thiomargarita nelsonii TaxID=1003181 RepID=A0A176RSK7_9GAMM|nr:peptidase C14 caspase catalytic subunit p20 [Candidatus Thiomargarita nelsonii]